MIRTYLGKSRVRESRTLGSVGAKPNGLATRPSPIAATAIDWLRMRQQKDRRKDGEQEFRHDPIMLEPSQRGTKCLDNPGE
jgi:hypothetical protein